MTVQPTLSIVADAEVTPGPETLAKLAAEAAETKETQE